MFVLGLTGSIGMGKSTASKMFTNFGVEVFDSDYEVHKTISEGGRAENYIKNLFPSVVTDNKIDRKLLGKIVFNEQKELKKLEKIIHPIIKEEIKKFIFLNKEKRIIVLDIPLLFEVNWDKMCDFIAVVSAPFEVQKQRVLKRDFMTEEKFIKILEKQMPSEEKCKRADFIIPTDKGFSHSEEKIGYILEEILKSNKEPIWSVI